MTYLFIFFALWTVSIYLSSTSIIKVIFDIVLWLVIGWFTLYFLLAELPKLLH